VGRLPNTRGGNKISGVAARSNPSSDYSAVRICRSATASEHLRESWRLLGRLVSSFVFCYLRAALRAQAGTNSGAISSSNK
ncbi:hypothetical protein EJB05_54645, partial [Eragrostis curvula]